jgi:hypothetical protein
VFVLEHYTGESHLNVGSGEEVMIADAANLIVEALTTRANSSSTRCVLMGRRERLEDWIGEGQTGMLNGKGSPLPLLAELCVFPISPN